MIGCSFDYGVRMEVVQALGVTMEDRALAHKAYEHFMELFRWYQEEDELVP